jgi:ElaB/YqjD/DUF883 family membrane-anchored ribosome-binding protein
MDPVQPKRSPAHTHEATDNSTLSEVESLSDSEWLDIASGRESDSDSIYSSRGTDQGRTSRSRSGRSSFSYGSSRDGDVDAWEGLIEDSADEGPVPDTVRLSGSPLASNQGHFTTPTEEDVGDVTEEQRVKEGLDQSMISTLSSSRSSSVHASTVITSSRDLRLSFPDPIFSSREELSSTLCEDIMSISSGAMFSGPDPDVTVHITDPGEPDLSHASGSSSAPITIDDAVSALLDSDLNVSLYGFHYPHKWSFVSTLLEKAVRGARLTIATPLEEMDGPVRQLRIEGRTDRSIFYPRIITVIDRTQGDKEDPSADFSTGHPSLAIVFLPFSSLQLPEHAAYLPVLVPAPCAIDSLQSEDAIHNSAQEAWDLFNVPSDRVLRLSDTAPCVVNADVIESLPPYRAYRAFDRIFSRGKKKSVKLSTNSPHTLTIFTMVSLVLGVVVGSTFRGAAPAVTPTPVATAMASASSTPFLWALLHPVINRSHESIPAKTESTAISIQSSLKDFALSVFNPDPTSVSISQETLTSGFRSASSFSEKLKLSKDVILRPTSSLMSLEGSTNSLSVAPSMTSSKPHVAEAVPTSSSSALAPSTLGLSFLQDYLPKFVDTHAPAVLAAVNADIQDIIDALDSLVQAISRQAHVMIAQTNALIQYSAVQFEQRAPELEAIMDAVNARNEHAQRRAKELKDNGAKWLHEAGDALTNRVSRARGKAQEIMNRASRAREKAQEITEEMEQIWAESREKWEMYKMRGAQRRWGKETRRGCHKTKNCRGARSKKCAGGWLTHTPYY